MFSSTSQYYYTQMGLEDIICNVTLNLSLGGVHRPENPSLQFDYQKNSNIPSSKSDHHIPSLTLSLSSESTTNKAYPENDHFHGGGREKKPVVSSFFNSGVKREREASYEEVEVEKISSPNKQAYDQLDEEGGARKKLRLTKEQSVILEDSFKVHSTLNPTQKQELAKLLNLRPRQVEVWFQNRRARTKLKQTEVDCELLKKCCEKLTDENRRLRKEVQELKVLKLTSAMPHMQLPSAATLSLCPSCEQISAGGASGRRSPSRTNSFAIPLTNPSAAC